MSNKKAEIASLLVEDNELKTLDANDNIIESTMFDSPKEANEAFDEQMHEWNTDESKWIEFAHYVPEFPPRKLVVGNKGD